MYDSSYYSDPTTTGMATENAGMFLGLGLAMLVVVFVFLLAFYAVYAFLLSRIFKKAGVKPSIAWVPVYSTWKMLEIGGQQGYWAVLMFVPIVQIASIVYMYIAMFNIGKKLGKEDWFIAIALFAQPIWLAWLALDSSQWSGSSNMDLAMNNAQPAYAPPTQTADAYATTPVAAEPITVPITDVNPPVTEPIVAPEVDVQPDVAPYTPPVDNNFQQ